MTMSNQFIISLFSVSQEKMIATVNSAVKMTINKICNVLHVSCLFKKKLFEEELLLKIYLLKLYLFCLIIYYRSVGALDLTDSQNILIYYN